MSAQQDFYSRICEAAGLDTVREHYGLVNGSKLAGDVGGFELFQRVVDEAKRIIREQSKAITPDLYDAIKGAMHQALAKAFEIIDWPILPDAPVDAFLYLLADYFLDKAYQALLAA